MVFKLTSSDWRLSADRIECAVIVGRACFVVGPPDNRTPVALDVNPHAWLTIEHKTLDVSPSFDQTDTALLREWNRTIVARDHCILGGRYVVAYSEQQCDPEIAIASNANMQRIAIYYGRRSDDMDTTAIEKASLIAESALTLQLVFAVFRNGAFRCWTTPL